MICLRLIEQILIKVEFGFGWLCVWSLRFCRWRYCFLKVGDCIQSVRLGRGFFLVKVIQVVRLLGGFSGIRYFFVVYFYVFEIVGARFRTFVFFSLRFFIVFVVSVFFYFFEFSLVSFFMRKFGIGYILLYVFYCLFVFFVDVEFFFYVFMWFQLYSQIVFC